MLNKKEITKYFFPTAYIHLNDILSSPGGEYTNKICQCQEDTRSNTSYS